MSDQEYNEIVERAKREPGFRKFIHALYEIRNDEVAIETATIFTKEMEDDYTTALEHAAKYLREHGRPEAAERIIETGKKWGA